MLLPLHVWPDVFGNALGESIARASDSGGSIPAPTSADEQQPNMGYFADGPGTGIDPLGNFIDQQLVVQNRRDLYSLSDGDNGLGFTATGGSGVRFSNSTAVRWSNQVDAGIASASSQLPASLAETSSKPGMVMTDGGWWDPNGLTYLGADGSPIAQVMLPPGSATVSGALVGGRLAGPPRGVGGPPPLPFDPRTDMPYGAPGFQIPERPLSASPPPLMGEGRSWPDILLGGLPLPARVLGDAFNNLVFKSPSDILGNNLEAAGNTRPEGSAAHHIVPYADQRARNLVEQLSGLEIDVNSADNGVFLPQVPGSTAPGAYHPRSNNKDYHDQLQRDFLGVESASQARDVLDQIRNQLLDGTYPGSKPVPRKP